MTKMNTCTIILPIDKKRSAQLFVLLQMFSRSAVIPLSDIVKVIPHSTFYALMYKLKILARLVKDRHGFDMFVFEKTLDLSIKKETKSMKLNTAMSITDIEGNVFVEFTKSL